MAKVDKEVKKLKKKNRKIKRALRSYNFRFFKYFLTWFVGMICGVVVFFGGIGAALKFVPLNTFTGGNTELLSEQLSQSSIVDAFMNLNKYGVDDMPVVRDAFLDVVKTSGLDKFIAFDEQKFTQLKFSYDDDRTFAGELQACIKVVASFNSVGITDMLGDLANISIFKEYKQITLDVDKPVLDAEGNLAKDGENFLSTPKLYYYQTTEDGEVVYKRAFDDQGVRQCGLEEQLYLPNLADIPLLEVTEVMTETMSTVEVNEFLSVFGAGDAFNDSFLGDILDDKRIGELSEIEKSDFLLKDILGEKTADNEKLYDILTDVTGKSEEELALSDMESFNVDNLHLSKVMSNPNEKLKDILVDALDKDYENIKLSDLSGDSFSFDKIELKTVLGTESDNPIIKCLINKGSSIGTISTDIDSLTLYEVYGHECFVTFNPSLHDSKMLKYKQVKSGDTVTGYQQDDNGDFVIDPNAGVWLLMCFDSSNMITTGDHVGRFSTYTVADETISHLNDHTEEHSISSKITSATVRQLMDVGIIKVAHTYLYAETLEGALSFNLGS